MEENKVQTQSPSPLPKVGIPEKAIRKIKDDQFSVFVQVGDAWCFLGKAETRSQAETLYREKSGK